MENNSLMTNEMIEQIKQVMGQARANVAKVVNNELITAYWNIGRIIVEHEQENNERAAYGKQTLKELSKVLTEEFGKGFSVSNLQFMRRFYQTYQIQQTLSVKLSWSHYCELLLISEDDKRSFYEKECVNAGWSVRELKRQMETSLYERLLLSSGTENKERVLELALNGNEITKPSDNPPIGIILCTDRDFLGAEYALGGLNNNIFASKYTYVIPDKEELIAQVEAVLEKMGDGKGV